MEEVILKDFEQHPEHGTVGLALILLFQTGLRSGEIVALKPNDIKRDYLTIERTETSYSLIYPDGTKSDVIYEIKDKNIRFYYSDCHDHVCMDAGFIGLGGESAVCLPNKVVISIPRGSANDSEIDIMLH